MNDDTLESLYLIPFKRYKHEIPTFKLIVISIKPVVVKKVGNRVENIEEIRAYRKVHLKDRLFDKAESSH